MGMVSVISAHHINETLHDILAPILLAYTEGSSNIRVQTHRGDSLVHTRKKIVWVRRVYLERSLKK